MMIKILKAFLIISILFVLQTHGQQAFLDSIRVEIDNEKYESSLKKINSSLANYENDEDTYEKLAFFKRRIFTEDFNSDSIFYTLYKFYEKFPQNRAGLITLGGFYGEAGDFESSIYLLEEVRKHHPQDKIGLSNIAYYHGLAGNYRLSLTYYISFLTILI